MKKMIQIRNNLIIILCFTIICMGIGYIVLSVEFKKEKDRSDRFDTSFLTIKKSSSIKGSLEEPTAKAIITKEGKEIEMHIVMNSVHDELSYIAIIKNNGTLPAEVVDIISTPSYEKEPLSKNISPVTITLSDVEGKIIPPGEEMELKILFYYNPTSTPATPKEFDYKIGLITKSR